MSADWLHIIPVEPAYVPSEEQMRDAASVLASTWAGSHPRVVRREDASWSAGAGEIVIQIVLRKEVEFLGMALETVRCPFCDTVMKNEWWVAAVDHAYESRFANLDISAPCCGRGTSLNDLVYEPPVAFSRFSISIPEPFREVGRKAGVEPGPGYWVQIEPLALSSDTLARMGSALGCSVRQLWVHF